MLAEIWSGSLGLYLSTVEWKYRLTLFEALLKMEIEFLYIFIDEMSKEKRFHMTDFMV